MVQNLKMSKHPIHDVDELVGAEYLLVALRVLAVPVHKVEVEHALFRKIQDFNSLFSY